MNATLLSELLCLTTLVNGKFVIINPIDNTYKTYNPGKYCGIVPQEFNPEDYALLITENYSIVIEATAKMREKALVNKLWKEQYKDIAKGQLEKNLSRHDYKVGDKVHLHNKDGIYTIHAILKSSSHVYNDVFRLTCGTWQNTDTPFRSYDYACIKCLAGGINNLHRK